MGKSNWVKQEEQPELLKNHKLYYERKGKRVCAAKDCDKRLNYLNEMELCCSCNEQKIERNAHDPNAKPPAPVFPELLGAPLKQFCSRGHDTFFWGRSGTTCRACQREDNTDRAFLKRQAV